MKVYVSLFIKIGLVVIVAYASSHISVFHKKHEPATLTSYTLTQP